MTYITISNNDISLMKLIEKIRPYSLRKLKKMSLNIVSSDNGDNLLFFAKEDLLLMEKLIQAGVNINHKNYEDRSILDYALTSENTYDMVKLLCKYNVNLQRKNKNLLIQLSRSLDIDNQKDLDKLSQIQLLFLSKNKDLVLSPPFDVFSCLEYEQLRTLSTLTPDALRYLKNYTHIDIFNIKDAADNNFLFYIMESKIYNYSDFSLTVLDKLLNMLTEEQINILNDQGENILWETSLIYSDDKLNLLKKHKLNFNHKNKYGQSILESIYHDNSSFVEKMINYDISLSSQCLYNLFSQNKLTMMKHYHWDEKTYDLIYPVAKKQYADLQKKEIISSLNNDMNQNKIRRNRL